MAIQKKNKDLSYDGRSNFGAKGWWIIIFSMLHWFMFSNLGSAALNVIVPGKAIQLGVEQGTLLSFSTIAGIIAVIAGFFMGRVVAKLGVKMTNIILLIIAICSTIFWGATGSVFGYVIGLILVFSAMASISLVAGSMAVTNWFPKKKGIALGWATMGLNISSMAIVPFLNFCTNKFGEIKYGMFILAGFLVFLLILNIFAFKNYPEEWNAYPDNNPEAVLKTNMKSITGWTLAKVFKTKEVWMLAIGNGIFMMVTLGFVSTLVPSMISKGFAPPQAVMMMTISGAVGLLGSYLCGLIDQKLGSQKAAIIYGIYCAVGIVFFFIPGHAAAWVYLIVVGLSIGGSNNFPVSFTAQVFGRDGMAVAFPVVHLIKGLFAYLVYVILGQSLNFTGKYNLGWVIILVLCVVASILFYICNLDPKKDPINNKE